MEGVHFIVRAILATDHAMNTDPHHVAFLLTAR